VWRRVGDAPCARALSEAQRHWLGLFEAVALRDAGRMASLGVAILDDTGGAASPASEYAFFAAATALASRGDRQSVQRLLAHAPGHWVRSGVRATELRFLDSATRPPGPARAAAAAAPGPAPHS
jgi:hypothetical protein